MPEAMPEAGRRSPEVSRWLRWAALLSVPAIVLGILLYPDIQQRTMSLMPAALLLVAVTVALVASGRPHLLVLLPLIASFLPSMQVGFLAYVLALAYALVDFGPARLTRPLDTVDRLLVVVLVCTVASWLVNLGPETDAWSLPVFALTFLSPWLLLFVARAAPWTADDLRVVLAVWLALALSQVAPALLKPLLVGSLGAYTVPLVLVEVTEGHLLRNLVLGGTGDLTSGSMRSAHHLGFLLLIALTVLGAVWLLRRDRRLAWVLAVTFFVLLMTDAKHLLLAAMPGTLLLGLAVAWPRLGELGRRAAMLVGAVALVVIGGWAGPRMVSLVRTRLWQPYASLAQLNPKVRLIDRTTSRLSRDALAAWVGYGPGSFASRAATIRATDVLYKSEQQLPGFIPPHTGEAYRATAFDLYTSQIALASRFRSGALTNPFSSLVGIVAEYGLLGTLALLLFLGSLARRGWESWRATNESVVLRAAGLGLAFALPLLVCASLFDSYFEQPDVTAPIIVLALAVLAGRDARQAQA